MKTAPTVPRSRNTFQPINPMEYRYQGEHPARTLFQLYHGQYGLLIAAAAAYLVKHSPVWIAPIITAYLIDQITTPTAATVQHLIMAGLLLAALTLQNIPTHALYVWLQSIAVRNMETRLRSAICRRLQHLSIGFYTRHSAGVLQTKVMRDVEMIEQLSRQLFDVGLSGITNLSAALITTAVRAPAFLLFFVVCVPVAAVLIRLMRGRLQKRNTDFRVELEQLSARLSEMTLLIPVTRAHGVEEAELERVDLRLAEVRQAGIRLDSINAVFGALAWSIFQLGNMLCLVTASFLYLTRRLPLTLGDVVLLTGYFSTITNAVLALTNFAPQLSRGFESIRSIGEVLECPDLELNEGKAAVTAVRGEIVFEHISFAYPGTDTSAVHDFSLHVQPGETLAIVGHSGAGKSTLLNLVIGFLRPAEGRLWLDGRDMNALDLRTYRRFLSVVPQETILFDGTIRDNVLYGAKAITDEQLWRALDDAHAAEFIHRLPHKLGTLVGERGARLSGGQKQRLAIARALIRDPRVLLLDEATSAVDTFSETLIQEALERLMKNRTTFVVAHRLSTIRHATRIVVLDQGRMVECGPHADLLALGGYYARLYGVQS